jgi:hypothetical protein
MSRNARGWTSVVVCVSLVFCACSALAAETKDKTSQKRAEIDPMASKSLQEVLAKSPDAKALDDKAYGYAVFENLKTAIGISNE